MSHWAASHRAPVTAEGLVRCGEPASSIPDFVEARRLAAIAPG